MLKGKIIYLTFGLLWIGNFYSCQIDNKSSEQAHYIQSIHDEAEVLKSFITHANEAYNDSIALIINFKRTSGDWRFFIYNLKNNEIIDKGLVTHGSGSDKGAQAELYFSNIPESLCTSLGKYKVGYSYMGDFGKAYKLYGLDTTNDKAFERFIVFHAHECVPNIPVETSICLSWGCPTVSPQFFQKVATYIDNS